MPDLEEVWDGYLAKFNAKQRRDANGRWVAGSGEAGTDEHPVRRAMRRVGQVADTLDDVVYRAHGRRGTKHLRGAARNSRRRRQARVVGATIENLLRGPMQGERRRRR